MKGIAAVIVVLAFAGVKATPRRRTRDAVSQRPSGSMEILTSNGSLAGTIKCEQQEDALSNTLTDITGTLPGLPPGDYLSIVHRSETFNGSCDSAGPIIKRLHTQGHLVKWSAFPMITVPAESHIVQSFPGQISFDRGDALYLPGRLVLFYRLPRNSQLWFDEPSQREKLPPAAACGVFEQTSR